VYLLIGVVMWTIAAYVVLREAQRERQVVFGCC